MSWAFAIVLVLLLAAGSFFILVGSLGLVKLSDFFKRLHGIIQFKVEFRGLSSLWFIQQFCHIIP